MYETGTGVSIKNEINITGTTMYISNLRVV